MQPEVLREITTVNAFDAWLRWLSIVSVPISIGLGLLWAKRLKSPNRWLLGILTGLMVGLLMPALYGLWRLHLWRIRIDLDRNFVGLHRVDVLVGNFLLFVVAGVVVGLIVRTYTDWLHRQLTRGG